MFFRAVALLLFLFVSGGTFAQARESGTVGDYPARPIRFIIGFLPGNWRAALNALRDRMARPAGAVSPAEWRHAVQSLVVSSVGQVRHADRLNAALRKLDEFESMFDELGTEGITLRERSDSVRLSLETRNLIQVARMLATAALERKESRGGHFRLDFPALDGNYVGNIVLWGTVYRRRSADPGGRGVNQGTRFLIKGALQSHNGKEGGLCEAFSMLR